MQIPSNWITPRQNPTVCPVKHDSEITKPRAIGMQVTSTAKIWFGRGIIMLHSKYGQSSLPNAGFVGRGGRGTILSSISRIGEMPPVDVHLSAVRGLATSPRPRMPTSHSTGLGALGHEVGLIAGPGTVLIFKNSACRVSSER